MDLQPDTLCTFSPDPAEQPDARWSGIGGGDEDMESNVRYAVAIPGILKLWPWVNQVCHYCCDPSLAFFLTRSDTSHGLLKIAPRGCHAGVQTHGVCRTAPYPLRHRAFLTPSLPPLCSPRVILVEDLGTLVGLTSVKDVLHLEPHEQLNSPIVAWSNRGALDGALEELWTWLANVRSSINAWYGRASSRWR